MGGHTGNRDVGYGVHSYINFKMLGGHVPVCPPYEYGPDITMVIMKKRAFWPPFLVRESTTAPAKQPQISLINISDLNY